jgi:crossover junction endodeoxyribonuclease RuvC
MPFVGIDPSTKTGLVVLDEDGTILMTEEIKTKINQDPHRFIDIADNLLNELDTEDIIVLEGFSFGSKGQGVSVQYGIGWQIRSELIRCGFKYIEVPPSVLKKFATGKGNCKKEDMVLPIYKKWGFEHKSDNVRDAYVLARIGMALHGKEKLTKVQEESLKKVVV